jgi:glucose-1-phosphate thymidylyltransferase
MGQSMTGDYWAVMPVAGSGMRLRPHTHTRPKPLLHVAGQPIIGHILDQLVPLGIERIVLVVGYMGDLIVDYVRQRSDFAAVEYVEQKELLGLGHAISLTRPVVADQPMLMVYGDTIFQADLGGILQEKVAAMLGVKQVEDPSRFGVVLESGGRVEKLVEKPEKFVSDKAIVGVNAIRDSVLLFDCLDQMIAQNVRTRGEFQLTDALQLMVDQGAHLGTFPVEHWFDCGTQEALLDTNRHLLETAPLPSGAINTVIVPPVHIDPSAQVSDSVVGPYVSIGRQARVQRAIVRNTIVGEQAVAEDVLLEDSLIGFQATVKGRMSCLNVGDLSQITR